MKALRLITALAAVVISSPSWGQAYFWGGFSSAKADLLTSPDVSGKQSGAFDLGAGYRFNKYLGAEVGYFDLPLYQTGTSTLNASWSASGYTAAAVLTIPVTESWSIIGKAGVLRADSEFNTVTIPGGVVTASETKLGSRPLIAAGIQYQVGPHFGIRGLYQQVNGEGGTELDKLRLLGVGIVVSF